VDSTAGQQVDFVGLGNMGSAPMGDTDMGSKPKSFFANAIWATQP
jgi:hypothetical protein